MTPSLSAMAVSALKRPLTRKRGGAMPFEAETRARLARLEFFVMLLLLKVFGILPGLTPGS